MAEEKPNSRKALLLLRAKKQFEASHDLFSDHRQKADDDLEIFEGKVWDDALRTARENDPKGARPCLTISDLPPRVRQITNDVRQNKPSIKVLPVASGADKETAEIFGGLIRNIENRSMAETAYETANLCQTVEGAGYFRIVEEEAPDTGENELYIRSLPNTHVVFLDPASLCPVASTARYGFIIEDMPRDSFERMYPKDEDSTGFGDGDDVVIDEWINTDYIRIAEWFNLETKNEPIKADADGDVTISDVPTDAMGLVNQRVVCMWRKISGDRILEELELPITYIPIIRVPGEFFTNRDGKIVMRGIVRDARDAVRGVSYTYSAFIESVGTQSKTPYIMAEGQDEGFEKEWKNANVENAAVLHYKMVDLEGNPAPPPSRQPPPMASQGIMQGLVLSQQALKDVTGMGAASLGQKGNETSGRAILARQNEGDVGQYHIPDNLSKAMRHTGRILIQWIPHVYGMRKVIRIMGEDNEPKTITMKPDMKNQASMQAEYFNEQLQQTRLRRIYNLNVGVYDVVTSIGPSYSTRRQETAERMEKMFQAAPNLMQLIGDIYFDNVDGIDGSDRIAKRMKALLPPQVQQEEEADEGEVSVPQLMNQLQQLQSQLQEGAQIVQGLQAQNDELQQKLEEKQGEIQAKMHDTQVSHQTDMARIQADLQRNYMDNQTKLTIAGMQDQLNKLTAALSHFQTMNAQQMQFQQAQDAQDMAVTKEAINYENTQQQRAQQDQQFAAQQEMAAQQQQRTGEPG